MNEKMPETLEAALKGAEILLAENGDISADGVFGERWFVFTPEELRVYSSDGAEPWRLDTELPVGKVSALETLDMVGCGALEARTPQGVTQLLRYSAAKARDFARAAKKFKEWKEAGEFAPESKEELDDNRCPQCRLPLAEGTKICPVCSEKGQAVRRLLFLAAAHRWRLALVLLLTVTYNVAHLMPPYMTKRIIDDILTPRQNLHLLKWFVLFFASLLVLQTIVQTAIGFLSARLGHVVVRDLRNQLFAHVQRLTVSFYDKFKTGTLMSRIDHDTNQLMGFLVDGLQYTVINVLTIIGIGVWLFVLNWRLAFLVLIPTPLVVLATLKVWKRLHQAFHRWRESHARLAANLQDTISGVRIVKAFAQEPREIGRFNSRSEDLYRAGVHVDRQFAALFPLMNLLMSSGALLVWYFGGYDVGGGRMSLGDLVAFNLYIGMFYGPFSMLTRISQWFNRHVTAAQRVFEIMDMDVEAPGDRDAQAMPYIEGRVAFKNATFGYDKLKPVLKNIS
ncbi:MAG TPA: ABC transporter transmembrane domain-containing protein, partial [Sumerlaeia bacterium]|nr:ABC transporter transmembrane domain-containing protein [Sumerlaeia bacterium]